MITDKINEIIRENLPEKVGSELNKVLTDYEHKKSENERLHKDFEYAEDQINKLRERNEKLTTELSAHQRLDERELNLEKRERELQMELLQTKLESTERAKEEIFDLAKIAFKNKDFFKPSTRVERMASNVTYDHEGRRIVNPTEFVETKHTED